MSCGTILYIENDEPQGKALKKAIELRGFNAEVAGNVQTARSLIDKLKDQLDVLVLDMRLEDPEWPQMTGADVAIEFYSAQMSWPPEFLVLSAYSKVDYFKLALKLGVASYLDKSESRQEDVIRHIRALTLRRSLSAKRPNAAEQIEVIVETSKNRSEAVVTFCQKVLAENFRNSLGVPFVLLLTQNNQTQYCAGDVDWPQSLCVYEMIQALTFSHLGSGEPFVINANEVPSPNDPVEKEVLAKLHNAAFLPLSITRNLLLSVGILNADPAEYPLAEKPKEMANVLAKYLESAVLELFLTILTLWAERETKRKELIRITSEVCLYVGQEQISILQKERNANSDWIQSPAFENLYALSTDLRATGNVLNSLRRSSITKDGKPSSHDSVKMPEFIQEVWNDLDDRIPKDRLKVKGECVVHAEQEDLLIIVSRLLQWFAQRLDPEPVPHPEDIEPAIKVSCYDRSEHSEMIFEDRSRRLDKILRDRLFDPFAETVTAFSGDPSLKDTPGLYLPLYLSKMIVEVRYQGVLEDCSDELAGQMNEQGEEIGHRFLLRFPKFGQSE